MTNGHVELSNVLTVSLQATIYSLQLQEMLVLATDRLRDRRVDLLLAKPAISTNGGMLRSPVG
jgi:hypothetical protein